MGRINATGGLPAIVYSRTCGERGFAGETGLPFKLQLSIELDDKGNSLGSQLFLTTWERCLYLASQKHRVLAEGDIFFFEGTYANLTPHKLLFCF